MSTITALPSPPTTNDPINFATRADTFFASIPNFATEANVVAGEVNTASNTASAKALEAATAANSAAFVANATQWVANTSYIAGACVWSPIDFGTFRRRTGGAGVTDPSLDTTNWTRISSTGADVTLSGTQTLTNKTLTRPVLTAPRENYVALTGSSPISINSSLGSVFRYTCTANTTFTINTASAPNEQVISFILELVNAGGFTMTWPTGTRWQFGTAPSLTVSGTDILGFYSYDQGTTWRANLISRDSR